MSKTLLKKLKIQKFRGLSNTEISFGTDLTVLCGKNGTAKSSILGIAAQIFSFDKGQGPKGSNLNNCDRLRTEAWAEGKDDGEKTENGIPWGAVPCV